MREKYVGGKVYRKVFFPRQSRWIYKISRIWYFFFKDIISFKGKLSIDNETNVRFWWANCCKQVPTCTNYLLHKILTSSLMTVTKEIDFIKEFMKRIYSLIMQIVLQHLYTYRYLGQKYCISRYLHYSLQLTCTHVSFIKVRKLKITRRHRASLKNRTRFGRELI